MEHSFADWHSLLILTFVLGMKHGLDADHVALIASRTMGLVVAGISLLVAVLGLAKLASPAIGAWSEGKELAFGFTLITIIALSFVMSVWLVRRQAQVLQKS